jgi:hypothetical protein
LPRIKGKPYIRAAQSKEAHRRRCCELAIEPDFEFPHLHAGLQAYQGGFITKSASTRLVDRDMLQVKNPIVFLHGAGSLGGAMHFGHLIPRDLEELGVYPVVRTDSVEQRLFKMSPEASEELSASRNILADRRPYNNALANIRKAGRASEDIERVLSELARSLENDGRETDQAEVLVFMKESPTKKVLETWLKKKVDFYTEKMNKGKLANVELRQILPGHQFIYPGTIFTQLITAWGVPLIHSGLMFRALYRRNPTLGGRLAVGFGAHLIQIIKVSVSNMIDPPTFDCFIKVEPFKALEICLVDGTADEWQDFTWVPLTEASCFVANAVKAWDTCDRSKFDFTFVPRESTSKDTSDEDTENDD